MRQVEQNSQFWLGAPVAPAPGTTSSSAQESKSRRFAAWRIRAPRLRAAKVAIAAILGAVAFTVLTDGGRQTRSSDPLMPSLETAAAAVGFGLDQVSIIGAKYTPSSDIYDALDLPNTRSFATLDAAAAKTRIESLPWIEKADLVRSYPGRLDIKVTERKPWAVWRDGNQTKLTDDTGRVLASVKGNAGGGLLRLSGAGAASESASLMAILARYPDVRRDLVEAERIAERRWNLKLNHNLTLVLPPEREAQALAMFASDRAVKALTQRGGYIVDLRAVNKITVREVSSTAADAPSGAPTAPPAKS